MNDVRTESRRKGRSRGQVVLSALAAAALAGGALVALLGGPAELWLFERGAAAMTARSGAHLLEDDALRVLVAGSSSPLPSRARAKACVAVFAAGKVWIVDSGPESTENLVLWGVPLQSVGGVLLTHFHSDHLGDLGELNLQSWAAGRRAPLPVHGGPGVERVVEGFNRAYSLDQIYRTAHHGEAVMPAEAWPMEPHVVELEGPETERKDRTAVVLEEGGLRITAIEVDHEPIRPAYAYRFDYRGRSVVVTGDMKHHPPLARWAAGADVLVSEALAPNLTRALGHGARDAGRGDTAEILHDIEDYHVTPEDAARLANDAGVRLLVYYHLAPAPDGWLMRRLFTRGVDEVRPEGWTVADDGSLYTLPFGTSEVEEGRLDD